MNKLIIFTGKGLHLRKEGNTYYGLQRAKYTKINQGLSADILVEALSLRRGIFSPSIHQIFKVSKQHYKASEHFVVSLSNPYYVAVSAAYDEFVSIHKYP